MVKHTDKVNKRAFGNSIGAFGGIFGGILKRGANANARNVKRFGNTESYLLARPKLHPVRGYQSRYKRDR